MLTTTWSLIPSDYISISWKLETIRQLSTVVHNDTYDKNNNEIKRRKIKLKIEKEITQMQYIYITRIPGIQKIIIITSLMMLLLYTNREVILIDDIPQIQMKLHQHMSSQQHEKIRMAVIVLDWCIMGGWCSGKWCSYAWTVNNRCWKPLSFFKNITWMQYFFSSSLWCKWEFHLQYLHILYSLIELQLWQYR